MRTFNCKPERISNSSACEAKQTCARHAIVAMGPFANSKTILQNAVSLREDTTMVETLAIIHPCTCEADVLDRWQSGKWDLEPADAPNIIVVLRNASLKEHHRVCVRHRRRVHRGIVELSLLFWAKMAADGQTVMYFPNHFVIGPPFLHPWARGNR